ncbi:MFS transporter [Curtobacterium flaccumfaciens]|uniref:MFS transporter n=1 Tax=Curtobacterium flaccumfaciens TaxID=2035 RepID=UPI00342AA2BC
MVQDPTRTRWFVLAAVATAQLMVVLDATVMNIALPEAQRELAFADVGRQWIVSSYALAFGALLLVGGRLNSVLGRKRSFTIGLIGFGAASVLGGLAPTVGLLIGARALQGVFGALLAPAALSLLTTTFPSGRDRARAFGVYGAVAGAGGAVGLLLGGALTQFVGWRWTLLINVLFTVVAVWIGSRAIDGREKRTAERIDVAGAVLVVMGLGALVLSMSAAETAGWAAASTIGLLVAAIGFLVLFVIVESRVRRPLLPLRIIADRTRGGALLSYAVAIMAQLGIFLLLSYYYQQQLGFSPLQTGLAFMPLTIALLIGATQVGPRLSDQIPQRLVIGSGFLVAGCGIVLVALGTPAESFWSLLVPGTALVGFGSGVAITKAQSSATAAVDPTHAGVSSALVNVSAQVGTAVGTALLTALSATFTTNAPSGANAAVHGYFATFWVAAAIMLTASALGFAVIKSPRTSEAPRNSATTGRSTSSPTRH